MTSVRVLHGHKGPVRDIKVTSCVNEPCHEKTCLRDFRLGTKQTGL